MPSLIIEYDGKLEYKQIKYMFQRLITALCGASKYEPYKEDTERINEILEQVSSWYILYTKEKKLKCVDKNILNKIINDLYDLDGKYLSVDGLFLEDSYEWILQLQNLKRKEEMKNG